MNLKKITNFSFGLALLLIVLVLAAIFTRKQRMKKELSFWNQISVNYPYYPDCWAKIAILKNNLNQKQEALEAIKKAQEIDPIREDLQEIENKINSQP